MIKQDLTCFKRLVQRTKLLKIEHKDNKNTKKIICNYVELLESKDNKNKRNHSYRNFKRNKKIELTVRKSFKNLITTNLNSLGLL